VAVGAALHHQVGPFLHWVIHATPTLEPVAVGGHADRLDRASSILGSASIIRKPKRVICTKTAMNCTKTAVVTRRLERGA
jgi:hypothetical protein